MKIQKPIFNIIFKQLINATNICYPIVLLLANATCSNQKNFRDANLFEGKCGYKATLWIKNQQVFPDWHRACFLSITTGLVILINIGTIAPISGAIMPLVIENIRLRELATIAEQNKPFFDFFLGFLASHGYSNLHAFVNEQDKEKALRVLIDYFSTPFPKSIILYDGIARPYAQDKAKWLFIGWIFRDAPEQRLKPILAQAEGASLIEKKAILLNEIRFYLAAIFGSPQKWEWNAISEVIIDRLEGSRRAIKGTLFEVIVRRNLKKIFSDLKIDVEVSEIEKKIQGETYDVEVKGDKGAILIPVKTRETMGGGHALLFTRDIHKSISAAHHAGFECLPIVIAESWTGDFSTLECKD